MQALLPVINDRDVCWKMVCPGHSRRWKSLDKLIYQGKVTYGKGYALAFDQALLQSPSTLNRTFSMSNWNRQDEILHRRLISLAIKRYSLALRSMWQHPVVAASCPSRLLQSQYKESRLLYDHSVPNWWRQARRSRFQTNGSKSALDSNFFVWVSSINWRFSMTQTAKISIIHVFSE